MSKGVGIFSRPLNGACQGSSNYVKMKVSLAVPCGTVRNSFASRAVEGYEQSRWLRLD